jgi:catechol 2,3-dioxygenase-like lactoylglutathione lyase family enzyme
MSAVVRLAHVCIESVDLDASEAFYALLGARRQFEFRNLQDELIGMYLYFGESTFIEIVKISEPKQGEGAIVHFALEVEDVSLAAGALAAGGVEVSDSVLGVDHTWMVTCHDPNGIFVELHQYTERSLQKTGGMCRIDYTP